MTATRTSLPADDSNGVLKAVEENTPGIDEVPKGVDYKQLFRDEEFMNEYLEIMLHPGMDESEVGVPVSVNGKRVYLIPGKRQRVRRFHVAQLIKARPDVVNHRSDDYNAPEREMNRMYRHSTSRYNFEIIRDTPRGISWARELRMQHQQK